MISFGSLIGSIIGFKFGGYLGLFLFAYLGYKAENWVMENMFGRVSRKQRIQKSYFEALFASLGKLAKADGVVTKDEIRKCESVMQQMRLDTKQRNRAIELFNIGKKPGSNIDPYLHNLMKESRGSYVVKQMFMDVMIEVAIAENNINQAELNFLISLCQLIRFPQNIFITLLRMRGFNVNNGNQGQSRQNQSQQWQRKTSMSPYQTLGVSSSDSKAVIRRAYKKLMSQNHPDKLIAKGLPPEMIEIAKTKTQNIQAAWEEIKSLKGY
jgi:DnaJ like chaperone protein